MKKLTLGLATAGSLAAIAVGLATPAMAAPDYITPGHGAYSTHETATIQPVDCSVHVNHNGSDVDVQWC